MSMKETSRSRITITSSSNEISAVMQGGGGGVTPPPRPLSTAELVFVNVYGAQESIPRNHSARLGIDSWAP